MTETEPAAAAHPAPGLRIGFVSGVTLTKWTRIWSERFPRQPVDVLEISQDETLPALHRGRVDMAFARLPLADDRLHIIPLYLETPVVVARKDHPIAAYEELSLADLADELTIESDHPEAIDLVAGGAGVLLAPQSIARTHSRRDLIYRPLTDGTPTQVGLAWLKGNPSELIDDFVGVVRGRTVNSSRSRTPPAPAGPKKAPPAPAGPKKASPTRREPSKRRAGRRR